MKNKRTKVIRKNSDTKFKDCRWKTVWTVGFFKDKCENNFRCYGI